MAGPTLIEDLLAINEGELYRIHLASGDSYRARLAEDEPYETVPPVLPAGSFTAERQFRLIRSPNIDGGHTHSRIARVRVVNDTNGWATPTLDLFVDEVPTGNDSASPASDLDLHSEDHVSMVSEMKPRSIGAIERVEEVRR